MFSACGLRFLIALLIMDLFLPICGRMTSGLCYLNFRGVHLPGLEGHLHWEHNNFLLMVHVVTLGSRNLLLGLGALFQQTWEWSLEQDSFHRWSIPVTDVNFGRSLWR